MREALDEARRGGALGEVPVGAVVVLDGVVVSRAHNAPISLADPTAHAEVLALRAAGEKRGNYRLAGATLYATVTAYAAGAPPAHALLRTRDGGESWQRIALPLTEKDYLAKAAAVSLGDPDTVVLYTVAIWAMATKPT